jgi:hypothetical protein
VSGPDPDTIARAILDCPDVAALSDAVATYLPGRRVAGVVIRGARAPIVEVHIVARWGSPMTGIAEQVRTAVRAVAPEAAVNVVIDDLELGPVTG